MNKWIAPLTIFSILTILLFSAILPNFSYWGEHDWDQHFLYHGTAEVTIKKFHQFPLWNPFYCGGNPYLANPQTPFLSPFFLLILLFGTVYGLKIQAIIYFFIGLWGMYLLAKELNIKGIAVYLPPIVFMLGSWYSLRVVVGHTTFFPFALLPFVLLFYLKSHKDKHYLIFAALLMALMFLSGGIYPLLFTSVLIGLYALLDSIESKKASPIVLLAIIFTLVVLFSAIKLFPMVEFTSSVNYKIEDKEFTSYSLLLNGLLSRNQDINAQNEIIGRKAGIPNDQKQQMSMEGKLPWGWHEYSAYIGIPVLLLFLISFIRFKHNWKLIAISIIFLLLALGDSSPIPIWKILKIMPFFSSVHIPSRYIIMFAFCAALLAGKAASDIRFLRNKAILAALIALIAFDLMLVARPALTTAFMEKPLEIDTYQYTDYAQIYLNTDIIVSQYPNMLQNLGTWNCYERIHLRQKAVPQLVEVNGSFQEFPYFNGNAYFAETNESQNISYFSPNKVVVSLATDSPKTLVLNQNYYKGWKAKNKEAFSYKGLIAAKVNPQDKEAEFYYLPASFIAGLVISLLSLLACGILLWKKFIIKTSEFHNSVKAGKSGILSVIKNHRDQRGDDKVMSMVNRPVVFDKPADEEK